LLHHQVIDLDALVGADDELLLRTRRFLLLWFLLEALGFMLLGHEHLIDLVRVLELVAVDGLTA